MIGRIIGKGGQNVSIDIENSKVIKETCNGDSVKTFEKVKLLKMAELVAFESFILKTEIYTSCEIVYQASINHDFKIKKNNFWMQLWYTVVKNQIQLKLVNSKSMGPEGILRVIRSSS